MENTRGNVMEPLDDSAKEVIRKELLAIDKRIESYKKTLNTLQDKYDGLAMTLQYFSPKDSPLKKIKRDELLNVKADELTGMAIEEALVFIAEKNNGVVTSSPARKVLVEAKILNGSQTSNRLWQVFQESEKFEQVQRGKYKLRFHVPC